MTLEERVAALEAKTQDITRTVYAGVPGLQINARLGVFTNFWLNQPIGQGAAVSIGTNIDRYALYAEIDEESCPDHPSVAVFGSVVPASTTGQPHIAIQGQAGNAPTNYAAYLTMGDKTYGIRPEGFELIGPFSDVEIGTLDSHKSLWP